MFVSCSTHTGKLIYPAQLVDDGKFESRIRYLLPFVFKAIRDKVISYLISDCYTK